MTDNHNKKFTFRQRAGRLNWKSVSSLDVQDIVVNVNVQQLQQVLDIVTFSEVVSDDIRNNTVDAVNKLIHIMQYMIEYLLSHQENQYVVINQLNKKINQIKQSRERYYQQNLSFREDVKTYQRQLHLLRKGIHDDPQRCEPQVKVVSRFVGDVQQDNGSKDAIVRAILDHEREARRTMVDLLDEQRREFSREMANMVDIMRSNSKTNNANSNNDSSQLANTSIMMQNMQLQIEKSLQSALEMYKENIQKVQRPQDPPKPQTPNVQDILKNAALEELERQLRQKTKDLNDREAALKSREDFMARKESVRRSEDSISKWHNVSVKDATVKRELGTRLMKVIVAGAFRKFISRSFRRWFNFMIDDREKRNLERHGQMLLFANDKKSEYQQFLQNQLNDEKEKQQDLESKIIYLTTELESVQERYQQLRTEQIQRSDMVDQLHHQLKQEKEQTIIISAKLNTATKNFARDKQELEEKLRILERAHQQVPPSRETSMMTSVDFSFVNTKGKKGWHTLKNVPPEFLRRDLDEEGMLKFTESKITNAAPRQKIHDVAKSILAKQIFQQLSDNLDDVN